MILTSCILYILLLWATVYALRNYDRMVSATEDADDCQKNAFLVSEGSDYLTEQVRLFVVTMDRQYMENYFQEIHITRRRDTALENLQTYDISSETYNYLVTALERSNELMQTEIYSMKLVSAAKGYETEGFPDLTKTELTLEDAALSPDEMIQKAQDMVFGTDYQNFKKTISANVTNFLDVFP